MNALESLEQSGEVLSPTVRAALVLLEAQAVRAQERTELLEAQVQELSRENALLRERVRDLEARLGMNSRNSSKPPSSDPLPAKRGASGRRGTRGAREGRPDVGRDLLQEQRIGDPRVCSGALPTLRLLAGEGTHGRRAGPLAGDRAAPGACSCHGASHALLPLPCLRHPESGRAA
jgi:hypothetical protein